MPQKLAVAGIQARMSSTRLPGKMLAQLAGMPLLQRVVERVRASQLLDEVCVLTSEEPSDDPLVALCQQLDIPVRRGSLGDVTSRYEALADEFNPKYMVRITGDCPLIEPSFIDLQIRALQRFDGDFTQIDFGADLVGTLGGQTVMSMRAFRMGSESQDALDREHVANFFFRRHMGRFRYVAASVDPIYRAPGLRLCVDEADDLILMRTIYDHFAQLGSGLLELRDVLAWLAEHPEVCALNRSVMESAANQALQDMAAGGEINVVGRLADF